MAATRHSVAWFDVAGLALKGTGKLNCGQVLVIGLIDCVDPSGLGQIFRLG